MMKMMFGKDGSRAQVESRSVNEIEEAIYDLQSKAFVILENDNGDFIQCTGDNTGALAEIRTYGDGKFKHSVFGSGQVSKTWISIRSKVGPVRALAHERLSLNEIVDLFICFYRQEKFPSNYFLRNITKQFI